MKLKSKLLSAGLVTCMVVPMAMPICAKEVNPAAADSQSTTLKYEVTSHYTWQIHSTVDFGVGKDFTLGANGEMTNKYIEVTENVISEGQELSIKVKGNENGEFKISSGQVNLDYNVTAKREGTGTVLHPSDEVLNVSAGENHKTAEMSFVLHDFPDGERTAPIAGTYKGKIIYTAEIVDAS